MVFAIIIAALVFILPLILVYQFYLPLPKEFDDHGLYRKSAAFSRILELCNSVAGTLFGWHFKVTRYVVTKTMPKVYQNYPDLQVNDLKFDGVPVRVYKPKSLKGAAPAVVYIHGGGWVILSVDVYDAAAVHLALNTNMVVISVEYRLAPEDPYPAAFEDCVRATEHVLKNGEKYGIDVHRVAIAGDSSGGNLAAAAAIRLAEEKSDSMPALKLQVLIYPVTQVFNLRTSSYLLYKNYPIVSQRIMAIYITSYLLQDLRNEVVTAIMKNRHIFPKLRKHSVYKDYFKKENLPDYVRRNPDEEIEDRNVDNVHGDIARKMDILAVDPYVSPLLAQDLSQLPRSYVVVAEFDVLRDDGLLYVHRLRQAGVDVELSYVKNQPHSFMFDNRSGHVQYKETAPEWDKIYSFLKKNL